MTYLWMKDGTTLRQYCKEQGYCYEAIIHRYWIFRDVEKAIEDYLPQKGNKRRIKHYYNSIPLKDYCKENGINYGTVKTRLRAKNTIEQAVQFGFKMRDKKCQH